MRQVALLIRGRLKVEEDRAGQSHGFEVRPTIAAIQMPTGVDGFQSGIAEPGGEFRGRDQGDGVGHGTI